MAFSDMALRAGTPNDLDAMMALERGEGFAALVGRSTRAEHEALFADSRHAYFIGERKGVEAFAILRDIDDRHGNVYLRRIAVATPGRGLGAHFLGLLTDWVFARATPNRFYLDCFDDNYRAQAMYAKLGFRRDGVLRQAYLASDGRRRDLVLMALLRSEWRP